MCVPFPSTPLATAIPHLPSLLNYNTKGSQIGERVVSGEEMDCSTGIRNILYYISNWELKSNMVDRWLYEFIVYIFELPIVKAIKDRRNAK